MKQTKKIVLKSKSTKSKALTTKAPRQVKGVVTALATPFLNGVLDAKSIERLVRHQLDNGVEGFVVNGTTGESPTLEWSEVETIYKLVRKISDEAVPIIVGTGSNCTKTSIEKNKKVAAWGADGILSVVPYYNKPPQRGLNAHFSAIADSTKLPIYLYNVPGRTVVSLGEETVGRLSGHANIVGIKEASGDIDFFKRLKQRTSEDFIFLSGDDSTCIDFLLAGGDGVISVVSHVIPKQLRELSDAARKGDASTEEVYMRYETLNRLLSIEANPIPVKAMLKLMGIFTSAEMRLPLLELEGDNLARVEAELDKLELL